MNNKIFFIITSTISFLLGILTNSLFVYWINIKEKFWNIRFIEILNLFIVIIFAYFLTYFFTDKLNLSFKKKELVLVIINNLQEKITLLFNIGHKYMNLIEQQNAKENEKEILSNFKSASIILSFIIKINNKNDYNLSQINESFINDFFDFKALLTDSPFGSQSIEYPDSKIQKFTQLYESLMTKLNFCKLELFS